MTSISIQRETRETEASCFRAVSGTHQSLGRTPGKALDALNAQLGKSECGSLVVIQQMQPDPYFSEAQYLRMQELLLMQESLTDAERQELEGLVKEELIASAKRTEALANALGYRT